MTQKFQAPRGTHDVLPSDATWWHLVRTIEELAAQYGYGRIQTPGFEDTALFARTAGEASVSSMISMMRPAVSRMMRP